MLKITYLISYLFTWLRFDCIQEYWLLDLSCQIYYSLQMLCKQVFLIFIVLITPINWHYWVPCRQTIFSNHLPAVKNNINGERLIRKLIITIHLKFIGKSICEKIATMHLFLFEGIEHNLKTTLKYTEHRGLLFFPF